MICIYDALSGDYTGNGLGVLAALVRQRDGAGERRLRSRAGGSGNG